MNKWDKRYLRVMSLVFILIFVLILILKGAGVSFKPLMISMVAMIIIAYVFKRYYFSYLEVLESEEQYERSNR